MNICVFLSLQSVGALKLTKGGFGWKGREGKTVSVQSKDIKDAFWTRTGNHGSLKVEPALDFLVFRVLLVGNISFFHLRF